MNFADQLAERRSPGKKFSDGVKALLAHPWRKRKSSYSPAHIPKPQLAYIRDPAAVQRNKAQSEGTADLQAACTSITLKSFNQEWKVGSGLW